MKLDLNKITLIFGIILPMWGGAVFLFNYEKSLAKKADLAIMDMDARIERANILMKFYPNYSALTDAEKLEYDIAKAKLINLETQRDRLLGVPNE